MVFIIRPSIVIVMLSLALLSSAFAFTSFADEVSYQVHSQNDLRQWEATFNKGARWFKVDFHYTAVDKVCKAAGSSTPCFVLTHDTPVAARATPYNSSSQMLQFVKNPRYRSYFTEGPTSIALCFKYSGGSVCDAGGAHWRTLVDDFFKEASESTTQLGFDLTWILDGSGTPSQSCLIDKWRPWIATYIPSQDPADALYSNDTSKGYDRFAILNMQELTLAATKEKGYGKFINSSLPFLLWEPSDQAEFAKDLDIYKSGPRHAPGFRFAINIDPVHFNVFTQSGKAWSERLDKTQNAVYPHISVLEVDHRFVAFVAYSIPSSAPAINYRTYEFTSNEGPIRQIGNTNTLPLPAGMSGVHSTLTSTPGLLWTDAFYNSTTFGAIAFQVDVTANLKLKYSLPLLNAKSAPTTATLDVTAFGTSGFLIVYAWSDVNGLVLTGSIVTVSGDRIDISPMSTARLYNQSGVSQIALAVTPVNDHNCDHSALVSFVIDSSVYMSYACISVAQNKFTPTKPTKVAVGKHSSVALARLDAKAEPFAMLLVGDSFCGNSHEGNIRSFPAVCDTPEMSLPGVMTYTAGKLADFGIHLFKNLSESLITTCNPQLLHGMFDAGQHPKAALFPGKRGTIPAIGFIEVHEGFQAKVGEETKERRRWVSPRETPSIADEQLFEIDTAACGRAIPYDGLVLDSFTLPNF